MIGNQNWFERRKYGGWGLHPKTWQGWTYIAVFMLVLIIFQSIPFWSTTTRVVFTSAWALILIFDTLNMMTKIKMDEREKIHEAISERNALWAILFVLTTGIVYDIIRSGLEQKFYVNPFLAAAIIIGVIVKATSNIYLNKKN